MTEGETLVPHDLDRVSETLPVGILRTDLHGRCLFANPWACAALGMTRDQALGWGWIDGLGPEDRERVGIGWDGEPFPESESVVLLCRATERRLSCQRVPVQWMDTLGPGTPTPGYLAVLVDVTGAHLTEEALRRASQELKERVRELDCLFEISRAVERSAGDLGAILREAVAILPRSLRFPESAWARITLDGVTYQSPGQSRTPWVLETPILVHGELAGAIHVGYRKTPPPGPAYPFLPEERTLLEAVAQRLGRTAERVKGRRLLREREDEMRQRLTHLTRVSTMGEMATSIAHEVNQPLTAIATYAMACRRMLENGLAGPGEVEDVLTRISDEAMRAGGIIHRLKDMVRRQDGRLAECDVNALIRDVEQLASVDARMHEVALSFSLPPDLPSILADGIQIQQVVLNLIRNGIDAVQEVDPGSRTVAVRTGRDGDGWIRVAVEDNGCGLPPGSGRDIFQPFFTTKADGMGMGLSISRSIVEAHRGHIGFQSNEGGGATFFFTLPALEGI